MILDDSSPKDYIPKSKGIVRAKAKSKTTGFLLLLPGCTEPGKIAYNRF
jgi:hypothetical protein